MLLLMVDPILVLLYWHYTELMERFIVDKADNWISEVDTLSSIAMSQLHAAYSCFTHGLISRWLHVTRTVPDTSSCFLKLEEALTTSLYQP